MIGAIAKSMKETSAAGLLLVSLAACSAAAQAASYTMYRDAGCGCCLKWADHAAEGLDAEVIAESADMQIVKDLHGVPDQLRGCHTDRRDRTRRSGDAGGVARNGASGFDRALSGDRIRSQGPARLCQLQLTAVSRSDGSQARLNDLSPRQWRSGCSGGPDPALHFRVFGLDEIVQVDIPVKMDTGSIIM